MSTNRETLSESSETNIKPETVDKYGNVTLYSLNVQFLSFISRICL